MKNKRELLVRVELRQKKDVFVRKFRFAVALLFEDDTQVMPRKFRVGVTNTSP